MIKGYYEFFWHQNMSDILNYIEKNPQETKRLIGLGYEQLQELIKNVEKLHDEKQELLEFKKVRIIAGGGGRKPKLSKQEQIILTLVYLRHLTTFQLLGIQFGVSESTANENDHTFKTQMIILPDGRDIVDVVAGEPGPPSDITLFRENRDRFDPKQTFKGDLGYKGESLKRVFVEHRIRSVKIFRVVQDRFRLDSKKYEKVILTICGLVRLRIGALILPTKIHPMPSC